LVLHILKKIINKVNILELFKGYKEIFFINKLILFYLITNFISFNPEIVVKTDKKINPEIPKIKFKFFYKVQISQIFWGPVSKRNLNVNKQIWKIINNKYHQLLLILSNQIKYLEKIELNSINRSIILNDPIISKDISLLINPGSVWNKNYAFDF
tara:strand:- start:4345 stop:4809 length:465 start_codon:yes stop_codon:yes gene_type:complete